MSADLTTHACHPGQGSEATAEPLDVRDDNVGILITL